MKIRSWARVLPFVLVNMFLVQGCPEGGGGRTDRDTGPDTGRPDGGPFTGDAGPDSGGEPGETIDCANDLPAATEGTCSVTAGNGSMLIGGTILTPGAVYRTGYVLVSAAGMIECVGCDCLEQKGAAEATQVSCPNGVVSPGLINAHEHITFAQNLPFTATDERYEHRHDWRKGQRGHTRLRSEGSASNAEMSWGELRFVLGGATSMNGSGGVDGFLRNLDKPAQLEGLAQEAADYDTFPLGDSDGQQQTGGACNYGTIRTTAQISGNEAYTPHISEGIDAESRNEFTCLRAGANDVIQPQTALIHGVGLLPPDMAEMANDGTMLIWSPRSNISLYGDTARVAEMSRLGVRIALGSDWIISGSMNMLREIQCARDFSAQHLDGFFSAKDLWLMATRNAAEAMAMDDAIGVLAVNRTADIAIFDSAAGTEYGAVVNAAPDNVVLVLRGGTPLYGDANILEALPAGQDCDALDVCGSAKSVCASSNSGMSLSALQAANGTSYPLFFCGEPEDEPSCAPERNGDSPSPLVNGSNRYTGMLSATDADGDGIADDEDLCPSVFDPIRPLDNGEQADFDGDDVGDACDVCPLNAGTSTCAPPDPDDRDADGTPNDEDNCPELANADQADADSDGKGDVCDLCPMQSNPGTAACTFSIHDVKTGVVGEGATIALESAIVTAVGTSGFFCQMDPTGLSSTDYTGIFVYTRSAPEAAVGDEVTISSASVMLFGGEIELVSPTYTVTGTGTVAPTTAAPADVTTGGSRAEALEGVLVTLSTSVTVTDDAPTPAMGETAPTYEFEVTGGLRVDDLFFRIDPFVTEGEVFTSLTGVLALRRDNSKLHPRSIDDFVAGSAGLVSFGPALSYAREGTTEVTFPTPLTVTLTRATDTDTVVELTSSAPGALGVTDVTIPAGERSATVEVMAVTASSTPVVLTAALDAVELTASVRVLGDAEMPTLASLETDGETVAVGGSLDVTITLDFPAPAGGITVSLAATGGTVPATVTIAADAIAATFEFAAGDAGDATVSATLDAETLMADIEVRAGSGTAIVINEVDYDQAGTDTAEFVELKNVSGSAVDLAGLSLIFVNGSTNAQYKRIDLTGTLAAGAYAVVGAAVIEAMAGDALFINIGGSTDQIQNGAPDGIVLIDTSDNSIVDALSYEGEIMSASITGITGSFDLREGAASAVIDSNTAAASVCRVPDGIDTNDSSMDWALSSTPTPGAANVE